MDNKPMKPDDLSDGLSELRRRYRDELVKRPVKRGPVKGNADLCHRAAAVLNCKAREAHSDAAVIIDDRGAFVKQIGEYPWGLPVIAVFVPVTVTVGECTHQVNIREYELGPHRCICGHGDDRHTNIGVGACEISGCDCADYDPHPDSLPALETILSLVNQKEPPCPS